MQRREVDPARADEPQALVAEQCDLAPLHGRGVRVRDGRGGGGAQRFAVGRAQTVEGVTGNDERLGLREQVRFEGRYGATWT